MKIGSIALPIPFCQAGLAGYSDRAMRVVAGRRGCPYAVTEALLDVILLNGGKGLRQSIDIDDEDHPVAGQIMGSDSSGVNSVILQGSTPYTVHRVGSKGSPPYSYATVD